MRWRWPSRTPAHDPEAWVRIGRAQAESKEIIERMERATADIESRHTRNHWSEAVEEMLSAVRGARRA